MALRVLGVMVGPLLETPELFMIAMSVAVLGEAG